MKVFYNGFNLHRQFPSTQDLVEDFIDQLYPGLENIEVSYSFAVFLVANVVAIKGAKNETVPIEGRILDISCNEHNVLVLLDNGELLEVLDSVIKVPKLMDMDDDDHIIRVSCAAKLIFALTRKGLLYTIPNRVDFTSEDIVDMKTGQEHCLLLEQNGRVLSFGRGSRGQLGHGCLDDQMEPKVVEALGGIQVVAIETGGWHSCALSNEGDLYVWGWNSSGQLGLSQKDDADDETVALLATPQVLEFEFNITKVGCGSKHTVILTDDGKLYGCGWNKYKQLRNDPKESFYKMDYIRDFSNEVVRTIKCGPLNTLILCDPSEKSKSSIRSNN